MKRITYLILALSLIASLYISGCQGSKADSEVAMQNFLKKVESGDYVIDCNKYLKTIVHSDDLVIFDFYDNKTYRDFAVMTTKEHETFEGFFTDDGLKNISFLGEESAMELASFRTLGSWIDLADGNIWDLFYNDPDKPLTFVSNSIDLKKSLMSFAEVGEMFLGRMQDVYLVLNKEDPTVAHIKTSYTDEYPKLKDVDIKITFGKTKSDKRAEAWMNDPDIESLPVRTDWGEETVILNSVFLLGSGEKAVPFPDFATYAFLISEDDFYYTEEVRIRDHRATQKDMQDYAEKLISNGFTAVESYGQTYYLLKLRDFDDKSTVYSMITMEYNNGISVLAKKYYVSPSYESLDEINSLLENNFVALPASSKMTDIHADDITAMTTEGLFYMFNYTQALGVDMEFSDMETAIAYAESYTEAIEKIGLIDVESPDSHFHSLGTEKEYKSFDYMYDNSRNVLSFLFKYEPYLTRAEAEEQIVSLGMPAINLQGYSATCKDHTRFYHAYNGLVHEKVINSVINFKDRDEMIKFMNDLVARIEVEGNTYGSVPKTVAKVSKDVVYYDEDNGLIICFSLSEPALNLNIDFIKVGPDFEPNWGDQYE